MQLPEDTKRGLIPRLRSRVAQSALRTAERMDAEPEAALKSAQTTLSWSLRHHGADSALTVNAKREVAELLERLGRLDEALQLRSEIATSLRLQLGGQDPRALKPRSFKDSSWNDLVDMLRPSLILSMFCLFASMPWGATTRRHCCPWIGSDVFREVLGTFKSPVGYSRKRWIDIKATVPERPKSA